MNCVLIGYFTRELTTEQLNVLAKYNRTSTDLAKRPEFTMPPTLPEISKADILKFYAMLWDTIARGLLSVLANCLAHLKNLFT